MTPQELAFWEKFKATMPPTEKVEFGSAWAFGNTKEMADELAGLVLSGKKTATASAYLAYERENEPLVTAQPEVYDILLDGTNQPVAIVQTTRVTVVPFDKVSAEHAYREGEGDRSLDYWQRVHQAFWMPLFSGELNPAEAVWSMEVVCEDFRLVWVNQPA